MFDGASLGPRPNKEAMLSAQSGTVPEQLPHSHKRAC